MDVDITPGSVVAGVSRSDAGQAAVRWAAGEAAARRSPLVLLRAWQPLHPFESALWVAAPGVGDLHHQRRQEQHVLQAAAEAAATAAPGLDIVQHLVRGKPGRILERFGKQASVVVVGGRQVRHLSSSWLGPVTRDVATHAHCPVVLVPESAGVRRGHVVVGVDGSDLSEQVVAFAFDQASLWESGLTAVMSNLIDLHEWVPSADVLDDVHERALCHLSEGLAGWCEKYPDLKVTELVTFRHPLPTLLTAALDADLLVVGTHGLGPVRRHVLGSVTLALMHAALCPVAVVPRSSTGGQGRYES